VARQVAQQAERRGMPLEKHLVAERLYQRRRTRAHAPPGGPQRSLLARDREGCVVGGGEQPAAPRTGRRCRQRGAWTGLVIRLGLGLGWGRGQGWVHGEGEAEG